MMENSFGWKLGAEGPFSCLKVEKHRGFIKHINWGQKPGNVVGLDVFVHDFLNLFSSSVGQD